MTDTPPWAGFGDEKKAAIFEHFSKQTLVGRVGQPNEVASAIVSIATNPYITGQTLYVDGGLTL